MPNPYPCSRQSPPVWRGYVIRAPRKVQGSLCISALQHLLSNQSGFLLKQTAGFIHAGQIVRKQHGKITKCLICADSVTGLSACIKCLAIPLFSFVKAACGYADLS